MCVCVCVCGGGGGVGEGGCVEKDGRAEGGLESCVGYALYSFCNEVMCLRSTRSTFSMYEGGKWVGGGWRVVSSEQ